jgi:hypothetical protein
MQESTPVSESHYDLSLRAGRSIGFYFRNSNQGVILTAERINWTFGGIADGAPFHNIRAVHLQTGGDWREPTNLCTITFADGYKLLVINSDDARRQVYRDFVRDLHSRLAAVQTSTVFTSGYQGFRYPLIIACAVLLGFMSIGAPVVAMTLQRGIGPITAMFAGVVLYWPLIKMIEKNAPAEPRSTQSAGGVVGIVQSSQRTNGGKSTLARGRP